MTASGEMLPAQTGVAALWRRQLHGSECPDRRLDPVVQNREVGGGQPGHRLPLVVQDGDVELHQFDAGAELRAALLPSSEDAHTRHDVQADEADSGQTHDRLRTSEMVQGWLTAACLSRHALGHRRHGVVDCALVRARGAATIDLHDGAHSSDQTRLPGR